MYAMINIDLYMKDMAYMGHIIIMNFIMGNSDHLDPRDEIML